MAGPRPLVPRGTATPGTAGGPGPTDRSSPSPEDYRRLLAMRRCRGRMGSTRDRRRWRHPGCPNRRASRRRAAVRHESLARRTRRCDVRRIASQRQARHPGCAGGQRRSADGRGTGSQPAELERADPGSAREGSPFLSPVIRPGSRLPVSHRGGRVMTYVNFSCDSSGVRRNLRQGSVWFVRRSGPLRSNREGDG